MYLVHHKLESTLIVSTIINIMMFADSDHSVSVKEAFELLIKALHQRQVKDEGIKKSQKISEGLQQDRKLYAELACKYDLRLAWLSDAQCLHGVTHSWVVCIIQ